MNVTKARPSTLEAAIVPPAQPILLPGGIANIANCEDLRWHLHPSPGANLQHAHVLAIKILLISPTVLSELFVYI